jgi:hypothetical protein
MAISSCYLGISYFTGLLVLAVTQAFESSDFNRQELEWTRVRSAQALGSLRSEALRRKQQRAKLIEGNYVLVDGNLSILRARNHSIYTQAVYCGTDNHRNRHTYGRIASRTAW